MTAKSEFTGIILAGGQSRRMGVDKALLQVDGVALSVLVARALRAAGACEVFAIGGDAPMLSAMGLRVIADEWPGQGPLGGLITGLRAASCEIAVAMACDQPRVDPPLVHRLVDLLAADDTFDAVVPVHDGRDQVLHAAYRSRAQIELGFAFDRGVRAPSLALAGLRVHRVSIDEAEALADLDTPEEFARYRQYRDSLPE